MMDSRNTLAVIFFIVLAAIGWSTYKSRAGITTALDPAFGTASTTTGASGENANAAGGTQLVLSASFNCADNTHFVAEFPADQAQIVIDGKLVRTLPRVNGAGQRYEDSAYVYVFAGEGAAVMNKATGGKTTCDQPLDQNNAPVNFGDAAEGGAGFNEAVQQRDLGSIVSESIIGTWKSTQDPKFVRQFKSDGTVQDSYDGKVVTSGKWQAFSSVKPLVVPFPVEKGVVYIQMTDGGQSGALDFKVAKLTPESLELVYMERGGVNSFTKVK